MYKRRYKAHCIPTNKLGQTEMQTNGQKTDAHLQIYRHTCTHTNPDLKPS